MYYSEDKNKITVEELKDKKQFDNVLLINSRPDQDLDANNLVVTHSTFAHMGFKKSKLNGCNFSHNVFIDCYFKNAYFENIIFLGCKFINCTFDNITLVQCDFRYATFQNCYVDFKDMLPNLPNLPSFHNVRWKMCTNLALESLRAGSTEDYRKYFYEEKKSSEQHFWEMFRRKEKYYRNKKYGTWDSIEGLVKYSASKINKMIWGYGENIFQLIRVMLFTIIIFALFLFRSGEFYENGNGESRFLGLGESFYVSVCNFFTINSGFQTTSTFPRFLIALEGFIGMMLMGFFIAALFRYINRR